MIEALSLQARHRRLPVLTGTSLQVNAGEIVGLVGANGSGKTTLVRALAGLHPCSGTVTLGGSDVSAWPPERRARLGLGHLDQQPSAFRGLSVRDNLRAVIEITPGADAAEVDRRADEEIARMGLTALAARRADRLSLGERRRLEVARVLCRRPRWLLCDEPLAGLDAAESHRVADRLRAVARAGAAVLFAAPDAPPGLCDRALTLRDGRAQS